MMPPSNYDKARNFASKSQGIFKYAKDGSAQLPLFASANEMKQYTLSSNDARSEFDPLTPDPTRFGHLMKQKYSEATPHFKESIAKKGVQAPIGLNLSANQAGQITGLNIVNGNHRFAVSQEEHPDRMMPLDFVPQHDLSNFNKERSALNAGLPDSRGYENHPKQ